MEFEVTVYVRSLLPPYDNIHHKGQCDLLASSRFVYFDPLLLPAEINVVLLRGLMRTQF